MVTKSTATHRVWYFLVSLTIAALALLVVHRLFSPSIGTLDDAQHEAERAAQEVEQVNAELRAMVKQMQQRQP